MFPEQLKKILDLIKKTGDRVVVYDASADESYVIMGFESYSSLQEGSSAKDYEGGRDSEKAAIREEKKAERSIEKREQDLGHSEPQKADLSVKTSKNENLTEEDLTDKINREISMWKNRDNSAFLGEEDKPKRVWQISPKVKDKAQEVE